MYPGVALVGVDGRLQVPGYAVGVREGERYLVCPDLAVVINEQGVVTYTEQVPEIAQEPDYEAALKA
jgi:thiol peroxidase